MSTVGTLPVYGATRTATDLVTLGKSGMKVTRLAFGTGSNNGQIQAALGQEEFTRLVRYAYDHGIRFFETVESYVTPAMLGGGAEGLAARELPADEQGDDRRLSVDPQEHFDEMRRTSQTEYFDIMLLHWQHTGELAGDTQRWQDGILEAQAEEDHPRARRVGARAARAAPDAGQQMAGGGDDPHEPQRHAHGRADRRRHQQPGQRERSGGAREAGEEGGHGRDQHEAEWAKARSPTHEDRQAAMRFAFKNAGVDCVTVGFKNTQEIDEAIENLNLALA